MALAMFIALPLAVLVLLASNGVQQKLSGTQIAAKINAGNRLEEYLQGIRVMKAYNLVGAHFVRLRDAFSALRRACIRQEALLGPFILLSVTLVRAGLTLMIIFDDLRVVFGGRFEGIRPVDFRIDQFRGVSLFLYCRRTYTETDARTGDDWDE